MKEPTLSPSAPFEATRKERFSYSVFFCGQNVFYQLIIAYLSIFFISRNIDAVVVGVIMLAAKIWDAVNDPLIGIAIDKVRIGKTKYKPWIRLSIVLIPATTMLLFLLPAALPTGARIAWAAGAFILWSTAYSLGDTPAFAMTTALTSNTAERASVQSFGRVFSTVGTGVAMLGTPLLYPVIGWPLTALAMTAFAAATMLPMWIFPQERRQLASERTPSFGEIFGQLGRNKYLLYFYLASFVGGIFGTLFVIAPYFSEFILGNPMFTTLLGVAMMVPTFLVVPFMGRLLKKFDKKILFNASLILSAAVGVAMLFIGWSNFYALFAACFVKGIVGVPSGILLFQFTPDCVEYGIYKTGARAEGASFSLQTLVANLIAAVSASVPIIIIGALGFSAPLGTRQNPATQSAILAFLTWVPSVGAALEALIMNFLYRLTDKKVAIMIRANNGDITRAEAEKLLGNI